MLYTILLTTVSCYDIAYLNLDNRPDRNNEIITQLPEKNKTRVSGFQITSSVLHHKRANAIHTAAIGCSLGHVAILAKFLHSKKHLLVLEDDAKFLTQNVDNLMCNFGGDVLLLGYNSGNDSCNATMCRIRHAKTTSAYLVRDHYKKVLLHNFLEGTAMMAAGYPRSKWCVDVHWHVLQQKDSWWRPKARTVFQSASYSDIEKRNVNYGV